MKHFLFITFIAFISFSALQAQVVSAKLIDSKTQQPIPFATIQVDSYTGTITNEEGVFSIDLNNNTQHTFSCLGYQTLTVSYDDIKKSDFVIQLKEAINELDEVYLSNTKPNIDSIISRVKRNSAKNYRIDSIKYKLFSRTSYKANFKNVEFLVKKATDYRRKELSNANKELDSLSERIESSNSVYYTDFTGQLSVKNIATAKLDSVKAIKLVDNANDFSIENIQERFQSVILKYLDENKTYKVKTGLFTVEDSMSLKEEELKSQENDNKFELKGLKSDAQSLINRSRFSSEFFINNLLSTKLYKHTLEDITYINGDLVYIIKFTPRKSKAKYAGTLYVLEDDYAVLKVDYTFGKGKRGQHVNLKLLLGIKFSENVNEGTILFKKDEDDDTYQLHYIKEVVNAYFYLSRPFKFIENSSEKNKVAFNLKFEGDFIAKSELLITHAQTINTESFNAIKEVKKVPYTSLKKYKSSVWGNEKILAPIEEMKQFKVEDD